MVSLFGFFFVTASVIGGYLLAGGHLHVLFQPIEIIIIMGAAIGSIFVACSGKLIKDIIYNILAIAKESPANKDKYFQLLKVMFELFKMAASNPLSLEKHVDTPETSDVFAKYPAILNDHHIMDFLCNTLIVQISSNISPYDLEDLMDTDIKALHEEEANIPKTINRMSDALPGLGIVAAVIGIVLTMGKLDQGKEVIGHSVAAALVGTFMGVLLSYGYFQPLAAKVEARLAEQGKYLDVTKVGILAFSKKCNPKVCVEFARRSIPMEFRPTFKELDQAIANTKSDAGKSKAA